MKLHLGCSNDLMPGWLNVDVYPPEKFDKMQISVRGTCSVPTAQTTHYQQVDLAEQWPWETSSVDVILAHEVFEHIGDCQHVGAQICPICYGSADSKPERRRGRASGCGICGCMPCMCKLRSFRGKVHVMNEAWRVLKPGGILDITVPCFHLSNGNVNRSAVADPTHATYWTLDDQFYYSEQFNNLDGERGRMGEDYGIKAVFRFPLMRQKADTTWDPDPNAPVAHVPLVWRARDYAGNQRAKLFGILEAVK